MCSGGGSRDYNTPGRASTGKSREGGRVPSGITPRYQPAQRTPVIYLPAPAVVTANKLNVRTGPGTQYEILGILEAGDRVTVVDVAGEAWVIIEYLILLDGEFESKRGYVYKQYLAF